MDQAASSRPRDGVNPGAAPSGGPGAAWTVLGLETSCDETAAAVVRLDEDGRATVLSSVVHSQTDEHSPFGGVVPEIAARSHVEKIGEVARRAVAEAGVGMGGLTGVAATAGPGLVGGVMVGLSFGKAVALARNLPLVAVNHLEGHAVSARLTEDAPYPFLLLLVSGGHCQLMEVRGVGDMTRLGATIDDAAGEAFDKIAKALDLGYPGGPALERLAATGDGSKIALPRALLGRDGCDFSFSGLKTAAARLAAECRTDQDRADLAAAVQSAIARQLSERSERAMRDYAERHQHLLFVVAGGVAANGEVRRVLTETATRHGFRFLAPPLAYCTDNAAMIALAGAERLALGLASDIDAVARPRWPLDEATAAAQPLHLKAGRKGPKA
ncbi:tRNA (adenosine(37)-N6)-threonylcarbamoyltransferase complex transferase subunit TsaD [Brevundimonas lutea]|uniref:tRNA (adenosine(37)-N6)-threonylcarbamoyltransferase complex transferase subunit TsaD n=1 Tax=Brevundimonas lutea TaxID=2293980 RepID=UPI000F01483F